MDTVTKSITSLYHVFGEQAKIAVITDVNESEGYYVCDMLNGVHKVLDSGRHVPFAQAPFELTYDEWITLGLTPAPESEEAPAPLPPAKPEAKPGAKETASKGSARKRRGK